jgi:UDP-N-acetylmuramoyl-L-alanyl-D-glutamate--2,6-diaminopimelate ligase
VVNQEEEHDLQLPSLTTLDSISLHKTLNNLSQKGVSHFAFEASSHGLDQYRLHAVDLKAAAFTNFTQDHLDYHLTMEDYFLAKTKLFREVLPSQKTAVLNQDSPYFDRLQKICLERPQKILSYSLKSSADLSIQNIHQHDCFIEFDLNILGQHYLSQRVNLVGRFQLENLLCALGLVIATEAPLNKLIEALPLLSAVKGRMELVGFYNKAAIYVDYSHKPDALKTALENLRLHTKGNLWVVFGCGGNRDALKRPKMGAIASQYADYVVVTDDNPRFEDAETIRQQILTACPQAQEIGNRRQAIHSTIAQLGEGDVLLIAGKGHETGQIVGHTVHPFDDKTEVENFLKEHT